MRAPISEYKAVEEAAMKFVRSVAEGNSKYAKELFTEDAVLFGYLDGELEHGSIEQFYHNVTPCPVETISRPGWTWSWWRNPLPWSGSWKRAGAAASTSPTCSSC